MTKLANPREADLATEMPTDHSETRRAAIHLVDLFDVLKTANPFLALAEKTVLGKRRIFVFRFCRCSVLGIECDLVVRCRFRRQHFRRKIKRNARFGFRLVLRETFLHQPRKLRETLLQFAHGFRFEREQSAIAECFNRCGTRRAIENGQLAEKIAFAVESEIAFRSVVGRERTRASLFHDVHRPGRFAFFNNETSFGELDRLQFFDHAAHCRHGSRPKLLNS